MSRLDDLVADGLAILDEAYEHYQPVAVFALFSGGHDSLCSTHLASRLKHFDGCVHVNTGIGVEETRVFVRETCVRFGWPLREYRPPVPYEEIVLRHGFPGPAGHAIMYARLKERCLRIVVREAKVGRRRREQVMLVTGVRRQESVRRMGVVEPINKEKGAARVWVAPIIEWSAKDKNDYISHEGLPRNPVVELLCMSGECLCGAFAKPGELDYIAKFYPAAAAEIRRIEARAAEAGVHAKWGTRPPKDCYVMAPGQFPLCWSCEQKVEDTRK